MWSDPTNRRRKMALIRKAKIDLYANAAMTENLSMYAHIGFIETHRALENGFNRVYLRLNLVNERR
jgi:hypothetical protein